jgi:putative serine protease PepD
VTDAQNPPGRHSAGGDDGEPTQPIQPSTGGSPGESPGDSSSGTGWQPAVHQDRPGWQQPPAYGAWPPPQHQPMGQPVGQGARRPPAARVPGWLWPVVTALALVLGLLGGAIAGLAVDGVNDSGTSGGGLTSAGTVNTPPLGARNGSVAKVAAHLLPSTVQIIAEYDGKAAGATGSGFVLDKQGHVVTNNHVVEQAAQDNGPIAVVDPDGNHYKATLIGRSAVYDLAVLAVKGAPRMPPASLGASSQLQVGEPVVAFGSPLGLQSTVTSGIVSALNRPVTTGQTLDGDNSYINAVQTDAAINPGNSGGPLVNLRGQVVGVNSAIATTGGSGLGGGESGNIGVGFAIPIEQVEITADQILRSGEARYPVIGAKVDVGDTTSGRGATISEVLSGQPADDAGLQKGDLVTAVDGTHVPDGIALIVAIRSHRPGEKITFTIVRDGAEKKLQITLGSEVG